MLDNVNIQGLLVATGQNLKRLLAANQRRPRPAITPGTVVLLVCVVALERRSQGWRLGSFQRAGPEKTQASAV
jgi:hypothetical protein